MEIFRTNLPLWVQKLSDYKLKQYIESLNEFEISGRTNNIALKNIAAAWYSTERTTEEDELRSLANDVYREAAIRWHDSQDAV